MPAPDPSAEPRPLRPIAEGRYTDFAPVGEGGMGVVFLALDTDLGRQVALKIVRSGDGRGETKTPFDLPPPPPDDPGEPGSFGDLRDRFLREAMVTGMMEHPGVIPVYELGRTEAGVPYYTMRYVKGRRTLRTAMREAKSLDDRLALLEPFLRVCDTIAYAHARGILHRDLKPENVALGEFGEVIVLDWGLAKITGRTPGEAGAPTTTKTVLRLKDVASHGNRTVEGVLGTPGYMSPEAAAGDLDRVGEAADVYSLGVLLFELLTGRLPFDASDLMLWLEKVVRQDAPRARSVEPAVPAELDALCAQALRRDRVERIESVRELAARVRAWQRSSAAERERETRLAAAEAALASAEGLTGAALLGALDRASAAATRVLEAAPGDERAQSLLERANGMRERGIREREAATRRKLLTRVAAGVLAVGAGAGFFVAKAIDEKRERAETAEANTRAALARAEREKTRADAEALDAKVQSAHAVAQRAIADKQREFAEEAGRKAAAAEEATKANLERAESLLNFLVFRVAGELRPLGRLDALEGVASRALEYFDAVPPESLSADSLRHKSVALDILGDVQQERGDHAGALASYGRALEIARRMAKESPGTARLLHDVTVDLNKVGNALHSLGREAESLAAFDESLAVLRRLVAEFPDDGDTLIHRRGLCFTLSNRAEALQGQGDLDGAEKALEEALATARRLLDRDPKDVESRALVASMLEARGSFERERRQLDRAAAIYEEAVRIRDAIGSANTSDVGARHAFSVAISGLGEVLEELGRLDDARRAYELWVTAAERVVEADETNVSWVRSLIFAHEHLARVLDAQSLAVEALPHRRVAYVVGKAFLAQRPDDLARAEGAGKACEAYEAALLAAGATEDALPVQRDALELAEKAAERSPADADRRRWVSVVHNRIGRTLRTLGRPDEAVAAHRASLGIITTLSEAAPGNASFAADQAYTEWRLGEALRDIPARAAEGTRLLEKALGTLRRLKAAGTLDENAAGWIDPIAELLAPKPPTPATPGPK